MAGHIEQRARARFFTKDFQLAVTVDQCPGRTVVAFRIAAYEAIDGMASNSDQWIRPFGDLSHLLHVAQRDIRDEIAEDVDVDHLAHQRRLFPLRLSDRKPVGVREDTAVGYERLLFGEPGGSRREDVPTIEGMPFSV